MFYDSVIIFSKKKSVTILCIYLNIKMLVIHLEQCSRSPQMLNSKNFDQNQNITQTYAALTSIFHKNTWVDLLLKTYMRMKISGEYLLFSEEVGNTFILGKVLLTLK